MPWRGPLCPPLVALLILVLAVLATGCAGQSARGNPAAEPTVLATGTGSFAPETPTPMVLPTLAYGLSASTDADVVASALNPLGLMADMANISPAPLGPELEAQLLKATDVPAGYTSVEQLSLQFPCPSGYIQMASNAFTLNGRQASELGPTVSSSVLDMPPRPLQRCASSRTWVISGPAAFKKERTTTAYA
jgi:hypothetical protein